MSSNEEIITRDLKRSDVIKHLTSLEPKITPGSENFKARYIEYICSKLSLKNSEVRQQNFVKFDPYEIKKKYEKCDFKVSRMLEKNAAYFNCQIQLKRSAPSVPDEMVMVFKTITFSVNLLYSYEFL